MEISNLNAVSLFHVSFDETDTPEFIFTRTVALMRLVKVNNLNAFWNGSALEVHGKSADIQNLKSDLKALDIYNG